MIRPLIALLALAAMLSASPPAYALTLKGGLDVVLTKGYDSRIASAREGIANAASQGALAPLLPQVQAYTGKTWLRYTPEAKFLGQVIPESSDEFKAYGIQARETVFDFGKAASAWKSARLSAEAQKAATLKTANSSARDFILDYVGLMDAGHAVAVAEEVKASVEAHLGDAQAQFDAGSVTRNDVLQAEVARDEASLRLIETNDEVVRRAAAINAMLLLPVTDPVKVEDPSMPHPPLPSYEDAVASALADKPDLKAQRIRIDAKEAEIRSKWADFMPVFFVQGGYAYTENPYMVHPGNWSLYAGATMDLFSGGATIAAVRGAKAELQAMRAEYDRDAQLATLEVQNAYLTLKTARERVPVAAHAVEQATEALRIERVRYEEGDENSTGVLDAVAALSRAELSRYDAQSALDSAEALYLYAAGVPLYTAYAQAAPPTPVGAIKGDMK